MTATRPEPKTRAPQQGFTMLELLVVVVLLGMVSRIVLANVGTWIPTSAMDSQANQLRAHLDYLRSEAKIQGKPYKLELDLDEHRYRLILPQEDKLAESVEDTAASTISMDWQEIDENVRFEGHALAGGVVHTKGQVSIDFDEYGFSADQTLFLRYRTDEKLIWSIHLQGLAGTTRLVRDTDGRRDVMPRVQEADF